MRRFYVHFGMLGAFWLASLPVYSLIISALPSWYRLKTISALHFCTNVFTLFTLGTHMPVLTRARARARTRTRTRTVTRTLTVTLSRHAHARAHGPLRPPRAEESGLARAAR